MAEKVFRTDKFTFLGYTLLVLSYTLFFGTIVYKFGGFSFKSLIMILLIIPVAVYFFFLLKKKVVIDDTGIKVFGITGKKEFKWDEISEVSVSAGRRYFLFIADKDGNIAVVDDSTENFRELLEELKNRLPESKLSPNYGNVVKSYKRSYGSIALIYIASFILLFILIQTFL
jgi:Ca2+/Na+ antiporter